MPRARRGSAPDKRRKDPKPRSLDGSAPWTRLKGRDPSRHYVLAYTGDTDQGPEYYSYLGYTPEEHGGGVSLAAGKTGQKGENIEMRGHMLMSISDEDFKQLEQHGPDGMTGQVMADERDEKMLDKGRAAGLDHLRGLAVPSGVTAESGRAFGKDHGVDEVTAQELAAEV